METIDGEMVYLPSRWQSIRLLLISAAFVAAGFFIALICDADLVFWGGIGGIAFGGLGVAFSCVLLFSDATILRVAREGITFRNLWRDTHIPWSEVDSFGVAEVRVNGARVNKSVGIHFSHELQGGARTLTSISRAISGFDGALPDNYGWDCAELAEFLNRLRDHFADIDNQKCADDSGG